MGKKLTMQRRDFLRMSGAAAIAAAFPSIISSRVLGAEAPSKRINIGVVGVGAQGRVLLKNALEIPGVFLRAVCDVDRHHREQAAVMVNQKYGNNDCLLFNDFRELTRRADIDAVIVATPDHWHALPAIDAVRHNKDIYVEAPLTLTIDEGKMLVAELRKHHRIGQTGMTLRSDQKFSHLGNGSKFSRAEVTLPANASHCPDTWQEEPVPDGFDYDMWLGPAPWAPFTRQRTHHQFRYHLDYAGGQLATEGVHFVDIAQQVLGRDGDAPVRYECHGNFPTTGLFTAPVMTHMTATYADGVTLTVKTREGEVEPRIRFYGDRGWIDIFRNRSSASNRQMLNGVMPAIPRGQTLLSNFIDCIHSRKTPIADIATGHRSTTICNIGNIAMQLRRPVKWDPVTEAFIGDTAANRLCSRAMRSPWALV